MECCSYYIPASEIVVKISNVLFNSINGLILGELMINTMNRYKEENPFYYHSGVATHVLLSAEEEMAICKSMQSDALALMFILSASEQGNDYLSNIVEEIDGERLISDQESVFSKTAYELNIFGLIDDVQTMIHAGDTTLIRSKRRKLMAAIAKWGPQPYLVYSNVMKHNMNKLDDQSMDAIKVASRRYIVDRNSLAKGNLRLVLSISSKYKNLGLQYDDLVQEGYVGLIKAVERFDYRLGYRFTTYAYRVIGQSIHLAVHKNSSLVRKPFEKMKQNRVIERAKGHLEQRLGRRPSLNDVASYVSMPIDAITRIVESQEITTIEPKSDASEVMDYLYSQGSNHQEKGNSAENEADLGFVENAMTGITKRDRLIVYMRFGIGCRRDHTLEEIAIQLGITKERVRQIVKSSIAKLRIELMPHQYSDGDIR